MLRGVMVAAAFAGAGCADVPEMLDPNIRDSSTVVAEGDSYSASGVTMTFAANGIRLPESLTFGAAEIFAENTCPSPSRAGIAIEPFQSAYGGHVVTGATSTLEVLASGPAVTRVEVRYDLPYDCFGKQSLTGSSTFTMFPSGRIVRQDSVKPTTTTVTDAVMCSQTCNSVPMDNATLSVHWALAAGGQRRSPTGSISSNASNVPFSCTQYATHAVGISWDVVPTVAATKSSEINGALVAEYTFLDKRMTISPTTEVARSTLFVADGEHDCAALQTAMRLPAKLLVDEVDAPLDMFDVYRKDGRHSRVEIKPPEGESVETGFALRIDMDTSHLRVRHSNGIDVPIAIQDDGDAKIIWFDTPLPDGGSIIVEAL